MPSRRLADKVALVTGGCRGIGAAICRKFARDGATVYLTYAFDHEAESAERVCDELVSMGAEARAFRCDLEIPSQIESLFATLRKLGSRLDILVNNAAVGDMVPFEQVDVAQFARFFNINVRGHMLAIQQALPLFGNKGGSVINISSAIVRENLVGSMLYTCTKASIDAMTRCLAKELGPRQVRVNSVSPGLTDTKLARDTMPGPMFDKIARNTPLRRLGQPDDIAGLVVFLASDDAFWVTGEVIGATGGL